MRIGKRLLYPLILILVSYLLILFFQKREIFTFSFNPKLIDKYFLSQDIPHEVAGKRLFLSDADIYLATGYLYAKGEDPSQYNFEHPPLIKYLFGFSTFLFNNPYYAQILLGILLLVLSYLIFYKLTNSLKITFFSTLLLSVDPLFIHLSSQTLLDIGQTLFALLYFAAMIFFPTNYILSGIALGLFAGTKFWVTPIFFIIVLTVYKIYKGKLDVKIYILHLLAAFITYCLLYINTFLTNQGFFNIIWHIAKTFKYRLVHNTSSFFGSSYVLFITGYFKSWWGHRALLKADIWTPLWPVAFFISVVKSFCLLKKRQINEIFLVSIIPFLYLLYLGVQAPFPRYFFIILPFAYLILTKVFFDELDRFEKRFKKSEDSFLPSIQANH